MYNNHRFRRRVLCCQSWVEVVPATGTWESYEGRDAGTPAHSPCRIPLGRVEPCTWTRPRRWQTVQEQRSSHASSVRPRAALAWWQWRRRSTRPKSASLGCPGTCPRPTGDSSPDRRRRSGPRSSWSLASSPSTLRKTIVGIPPRDELAALHQWHSCSWKVVGQTDKISCASQELRIVKLFFRYDILIVAEVDNRANWMSKRSSSFCYEQQQGGWLPIEIKSCCCWGSFLSSSYMLLYVQIDDSQSGLTQLAHASKSYRVAEGGPRL